jgi:hypothetical protein
MSSGNFAIIPSPALTPTLSRRETGDANWRDDMLWFSSCLRDFVVQFVFSKITRFYVDEKKPHGGGLQCGLAEEETRLVAKLAAVGKDSGDLTATASLFVLFNASGL